jgi:curved DNA-binding protein CbpA
MFVNYYAILGVPPNASAEEIKRAYRKAALAVHPDRGGSNRLMQRINEAWEVLGDTQKRREYDAQRQSAAQAPSPATRAATRPTRPASARPRKATGPRPPTFARIAGSLLGRALHALGGWGEPEPKAAGKATRNRGTKIVRCRRCGQKLRIQPDSEARIRCPKCRNLQVIA